MSVDIESTGRVQTPSPSIMDVKTEGDGTSWNQQQAQAAKGPQSMKMDFDPSFSTFKKKESPVKLVWRDIEYSVNGNGKKRKIILKKISGEANPGEVVALMGVSSSCVVLK
jgi:hypothetical protein